jgi:hypothetical protein
VVGGGRRRGEKGGVVVEGRERSRGRAIDCLFFFRRGELLSLFSLLFSLSRASSLALSLSLSGSFRDDRSSVASSRESSDEMKDREEEKKHSLFSFGSRWKARPKRASERARAATLGSGGLATTVTHLNDSAVERREDPWPG